ncbi:cytochrome P450 2H2-like isoform X1 [Gopherus flavomarginatus]|uniref:cytochrome P450 2H2-like isoform X1 n=1 Tax=Gopherus flavomarginatus TaxID=286002 RepID=UPI0021CBABE5|nr:cytochrome P450 2H2-like isoform X1 [Gopherus flavomarginatus]
MEPLGATTIFLAVCISCLLFLSAWRKMSGGGKLPPGPVAFPIIGNALQLNMKNLSQSMCELREKYGPIFTIYLGSERVVVLYGQEAVKEALIDQGDEFSDRGHMPVFERMTDKKGTAMGSGEPWKQLRRFTLTTLRDLGMGKKSTEERILEEAHFLVERLKNTHGRPFDPTLFLNHATSNVICSIVFGDRFDYEDEKFVTLINLIDEINKLQCSPWTVLYNFFPTLMHYIPGPHQRIFKHFEELRKFVLERVEMHRESLEPSCPRDFTDAFLIKLKQEQHNSQSEFTTESLLNRTLGLFFAGTGTTSDTLKHGLKLLMKYPEIEEKIHVEIDRVIGRSRSPCMAYRSQMPYTDAVVHEIQRFISLAPLGVPRAVTKDTRFRQYIIPKGTTIFPVLWSVLYDSKEFPNPEQFNPGHFLDENGAFKKSDFFMPFSIGKRSCLGEALARMELFLLLTTILQNFTLKSPIDPKDIDITPMSFTSNIPVSYQLIVIPR